MSKRNAILALGLVLIVGVRAGYSAVYFSHLGSGVCSPQGVDTAAMESLRASDESPVVRWLNSGRTGATASPSANTEVRVRCAALYVQAALAVDDEAELSAFCQAWEPWERYAAERWPDRTTNTLCIDDSRVGADQSGVPSGR